MSAPQRQGARAKKVEHTRRHATQRCARRRETFQTVNTHRKPSPFASTQNLRVEKAINIFSQSPSECSIRLRADHSTTMPLDVSPTATADIRMGTGPAGRAPQTVMQVRAPPSEAQPSVRAIFPI
jgi:hypothetical protein